MAKDNRDIYPNGDCSSKYEALLVDGLWTNTNAPTSAVTEDTRPALSASTVATGTSVRAGYTYAKKINTDYTVKFAARQTIGTTGEIRSWTGLLASPDTPLTSSWVDYSFDVTTSGTAGDVVVNIYIPSSTIGDTVQVRDVEILDLSTPHVPSTTTVEIEWIDSVSVAATGNKIYRDDVEIADIANGVQFYSDATAELGTEYKYEVQAYSATDETTDEQTNVNVKTVTTLAVPTGVTLTEI